MQSCMHIIPVPIRDRSVARGASGSRAGRTYRSHDTEHSRPVSNRPPGSDG